MENEKSIQLNEEQNKKYCELILQRGDLSFKQSVLESQINQNKSLGDALNKQIVDFVVEAHKSNVSQSEKSQEVPEHAVADQI